MAKDPVGKDTLLSSKPLFFRRRRSRFPEWAIASSYALSALVVGLLLPRLESKLFPDLVSPISMSVALALYSSVSSGMIALTGIVFSLTFVMVQFSAVAYSPRLVLWVSRDPTIWHSIGVFTATFLYAIAAMAWVDRSGSAKVPFVSGWLVVLLLLASVIMFIALIQRIGLLQINRMLAFTGDLGREAIEQMYPATSTLTSASIPDEFTKSPITQTVVYSGKPQALQALNVPDLLALSKQIRGRVEVMVSVGDVLIEGMPLLRVFGGQTRIPESRWKNSFETGLERTFDQDPKYALRLLVDIAIKALSPAINDPTTAVQALDQIQDHLLRLGQRCLEIGLIGDDEGVARLFIPYPTWEDFVQLALEEIRLCGATSIQVMRRMRALVGDLIEALPQARRAALEHERKRLDATIARSFSDIEDKLEASIEDRQGLGMSVKH